MESFTQHSSAWIALAVAFLVGSIPFGLLIARLFKVGDIRTQGSGNIGATNVTRVLGFWPAGAITFALDVIKGALPVLLLSPVSGGLWRTVSGAELPEFSPVVIWGAGLFAVAGHCYSPWLKFNGGKGVATGFGAILLLSPWAALGGISAFAVTFLNSRVGSLSSLAGLTTATILHLVLHPIEAHLIVGAAMMFMVIARHEPNLDRLLVDGEKKI